MSMWTIASSSAAAQADFVAHDMQVIAYKGWGQLYTPHSELATLVHEPEKSQLFDQETMNLLLDRLDTEVEAAAGFSYTAALKSFLPAGNAAIDSMKLFG